MFDCCIRSFRFFSLRSVWLVVLGSVLGWGSLIIFIVLVLLLMVIILFVVILLMFVLLDWIFIVFMLGRVMVGNKSRWIVIDFLFFILWMVVSWFVILVFVDNVLFRFCFGAMVMNWFCVEFNFCLLIIFCFLLFCVMFLFCLNFKFKFRIFVLNRGRVLFF